MSTQQLLRLGTDVSLRRRYFVEATFAHPAKLHLGLLEWVLERYTKPGETVADPMAGVGSILLAATMQRNVIAREIEEKWLATMHENAARVLRSCLFTGSIDIKQGDAREPWGYRADHVIFSPPYGCDVAKGVQAKGILSPKTRKLIAEGRLTGDWVRLATHTGSGQAASYLFNYGTHEAQIGHVRGERYWLEMGRVYAQAYTALRGGYMVLVVKDHIARGVRVRVSDETVQLCERVGFRLVERHAREVYPLSLWQRRRKERGLPVVEDEDVLVFQRGVAA